jgi:hypothetical protein
MLNCHGDHHIFVPCLVSAQSPQEARTAATATWRCRDEAFSCGIGSRPTAEWLKDTHFTETMAVPKLGS